MERTNDAKEEFGKYLKKWVVKDNRFLNGWDIGCGTKRIDEMIPSIDEQPEYKYAHALILWDCHDLDFLADEKMDFLFSSHVLEDFPDVPVVFHNWWKKLKPNGLMLLLLPDMQGGRYKKCGEAGGNPSHRTDMGKQFMHDMLEDMREKGILKYEILQEDTIPHTESSSIDFVIKKLGR